MRHKHQHNISNKATRAKAGRTWRRKAKAKVAKSDRKSKVGTTTLVKRTKTDVKRMAQQGEQEPFGESLGDLLKEKLPQAPPGA